MRPLEGIRVVDFTQAHAGSLATMLLADFGAEVIKIERKGVGDIARYWAPMRGNNSAYFAYLNRGKKSVSIDVTTEGGRQIALGLIQTADVVCENFKYGNMKKLGLDYQTVKAVRPQIIYASLNGFGQTGPERARIGLDLQMQALSGFMDRTGFCDGAPTKGGAALGDQISGVYLATAIMLALIYRKKTGIGQKIDLAIFDSLVSFLEASMATYSINGTADKRTGNAYPSIAPYDTYPVKDGYVSIGISTNSQWKKFCSALHMEDLLENEAYSTNEQRGLCYESELKQCITDRLAGYSKFEVEEILRKEKLACGAVCTVKESINSQYITECGMLLDVEDEALGKIKMPGIPIKLEKTPGSVAHGAHCLGKDTFHYLDELGYSADAVQQLAASNIIETAAIKE